MSTTRSDITDDGNYNGGDGRGVTNREEKKIVLQIRFHCQVREFRNCFDYIFFFILQ